MARLLGFFLGSAAVSVLLYAIAMALAQFNPGAVDQEFRFADEGFAVRLPSKPDIVRSVPGNPEARAHGLTQGPGWLGVLSSNRWIKKSGIDAEMLYLVTSAPLKPPAGAEIDEDGLLQTATTVLDDYLMRSGFILIEKRPVMIQGTRLHGWEATLKVSGQTYREVLRVFATRTRVYQLHVLLPGEPLKWQDTNATRFLESFSLLD